MTSTISRRSFVVGLPLLLAACGSRRPARLPAGWGFLSAGKPDYALAYAPVTDGGFSLPGIQYQDFDEQFLRQSVYYSTRYPAGTIVVDPAKKFLYLIQSRGRAMRYGIGVGRAGFAWNGEAKIGFKREWPKWFPPAEMIAREPHLEKYRDGQAGGPRNPIGARGLYLYQNGRDTLYRIHGTNAPNSIGTNASSGCIRMWQQDIIDLYGRVEVGAQVVVLGAS
ncbi:L,D-transpeptidase [Roseibium algae]|uniref:L,D-transpeptidase n=1 Tax=Roseibium algae TaxID=3123038 RepID=A0ABU8TNZ9_9HYPH